MNRRAIAQKVKYCAKFCYSALIATLLFLLSAWLWFLIFCFGGATLIILGVRYIAGDAYAYIVAGVLCFVAAALIRRALHG